MQWPWRKRSKGEIVLELESRHLQLVQNTLHTHIHELPVRAFGSRVCGAAKPHSDLDLVIMSVRPLPMSVKVRLEEAFTESCLPFKVDVLYWDEVNEGFRELILQRWETVQNGKSTFNRPS